MNKQKISGTKLAKVLGISPARGAEALIKAQLIGCSSDGSRKAQTHTCGASQEVGPTSQRCYRHSFWEPSKSND